jgi:hypothetical protein
VVPKNKTVIYGLSWCYYGSRLELEASGGVDIWGRKGKNRRFTWFCEVGITATAWSICAIMVPRVVELLGVNSRRANILGAEGNLVIHKTLFD